jgi:hypothetical protein
MLIGYGDTAGIGASTVAADFVDLFQQFTL